jgi:hypothetical protein
LHEGKSAKYDREEEFRHIRTPKGSANFKNGQAIIDQPIILMTRKMFQ